MTEINIAIEHSVTPILLTCLVLGFIHFTAVHLTSSVWISFSKKSGEPQYFDIVLISFFFWPIIMVFGFPIMLIIYLLKEDKQRDKQT